MQEWLTKKLTRKRLDAFLKEHQTKKRALDLGSSYSPYAAYFPNRTTCDIQPGEGVDVVADAHNLPFRDGEFDTILCSEVLEHLHTPATAIGEMRRVLKQNGTLILTTRFLVPVHEAPIDHFRYTEYGLRHLFKDWDIEELVPETRNFETLGVLVHRMAFTMKLRGGVVTQTALYLIAKLLTHCSWLVEEEYGTLKRDGKHQQAVTFSSGYYLIARKRN
jgi:SAM-dependent methyltransferase